MKDSIYSGVNKLSLCYRRSGRSGLPLTRLQFLHSGRETIRSECVTAGGEETRSKEAII